MKGTLLGRGQDLELVVLDSLNIGFLDSHAKDKVAGNSLCCGLSGVNLQSEIVMSQGQGTGGVQGHGSGEHEHVEGVVVVHGEPFSMAIPVVEFSKEGYKLRKIFG